MLTDEEIDRLFDGTSAWIPTELADKVPTYGRKRDGREIAVLVWLLIHQTESSKRQSPVPIHTECFKALGCSFDTVVKVKKWLVEHGFISVSDSYSPGWYSKNYATLHGRASSEFIFEVKSANQAMYRSAVAHDWWTPEGFLRFLSGDFHVRENEASTSFIQC